MPRLLRCVLLAASASYILGLALYLVLRVLIRDRIELLALINSFAPFTFLPLMICLPVLFVLRRWRLSALGIALVLIAGLWFGPYYWPKAYAAPSGPTLHLVTFNVWEDNQRLPDVEAWLRQVNADMVFLQEFPADSVGTFPARLKDIYPYQFVQTRDWRNVILSRYPFITADNIGLNRDVWPTQQRVTLTIDGRTLALYNVHLLNPLRDPSRQSQTYTWRNVVHYNELLRDSQIEGLLSQLQAERHPFIVAGDFNMSDQAGIYNELAARYHDSFREAGMGLGGSWPVGEYGLLKLLPPVLRLDYVWYSDGWRAVTAEQGPMLGSDHLPLMVTLELQGS